MAVVEVIDQSGEAVACHEQSLDAGAEIGAS